MEMNLFSQPTNTAQSTSTAQPTLNVTGSVAVGSDGKPYDLSLFYNVKKGQLELNSLFADYMDKAHDYKNWKLGTALPPLPEGVTSLAMVFYTMKNITHLDLSNWDVSNIENMNAMFEGCKGLQSIDFTGWKPQKLKTLYKTFYECLSLKTLDMGSWDLSNVVSMASTFRYCQNLSMLDVSKWNVANVTNFSDCFRMCIRLGNLTVKNWNVGKATTFDHMFSGCRKVAELEVADWDMQNACSVRSMFEDCKYIQQLDLSRWDTSNVEYFDRLCLNCIRLISLDINNLNLSSALSCEHLVAHCSKLAFFNASKWYANRPIDANLDGCTGLRGLDLSSCEIQSENIQNTHRHRRRPDNSIYNKLELINLEQTKVPLEIFEKLPASCKYLGTPTIDPTNVTDFEQFITLSAKADTMKYVPE